MKQTPPVDSKNRIPGYPKLGQIFAILVIFLLQACAPFPGSDPWGKTSATSAPLVSPTLAGGKKAVKIGILAPLTGSLASFGASMRNGVQLAIDEWNQRVPPPGIQAIPVFGDSGCQPERAVTAANQMINENHVDLIIGEVCSGASLAISELTETRGIVQISPVSTFDGLTINADGSVKKYIFRACFTDSFQGSAAGNFSLNILKASKAVVLSNPDSSYTVRLADAFTQSFTKGGGTIVGKETYSPQELDYSVILSRVEKANPDIIFLGDSFDAANPILAQARKMGIATAFIGGDGWDSPDLNKTSADGSYFTTHFSAQDPDPAIQSWVAKFQAAYHAAPDSLAALGYDSANLLLSALAEVGSDNPQKVAEIMSAMHWIGITGTIAFDSAHNPIKPVVVQQIKNGQFQYLTTIQP